MDIGNAPGAAIVLSHLSKSYGTVRAVRSVDLSIAPGETVALLGPNGAGKSTTIDMVLGLTKPDSGRISLFGMSPARAVAAGVVGGMLQTGSLIDHLTVRELVTMVASLYPRPLGVAEALQQTGASGFADRTTSRLSGGQTQRVRFAMALVANPDLLLLDEPTAALDVEGRRESGTRTPARARSGWRRTRLRSSTTVWAPPRPRRPEPACPGQCRSLILTTFGRPGYLRRAMESGACGFVVKDAPPEQLADAIRRVAAGERVVDPALAAATLASGASPLTARERDVLVAARPGATVAEIARQLFLSEGTVRNYLSAAIAKAGARNRAEAVRTADERGWL